MSETITADDLRVLAEWDTPSICNALELVLGGRQSTGFTSRPFVCVHPAMKPIVGYARTATIRSHLPQELPKAEIEALRNGYYNHIERGGPSPSIAVIQDLDNEAAGFACFWGEVNTHVHLGLGCLGVVTNGGVRDVPLCAENFQVLAGQVVPSHGHMHLVDFGRRVNVHGMYVSDGRIIHADQHGAAIIPHEVVKLLPQAAELYARREMHVIEASRQPGFSAKAAIAAFDYSKTME